MANVVLGIATSHGPMLITGPEHWSARVAFDKTVNHAWRGGAWRFEQMASERAAENLAAQITPEAQAANHDRCQRALDQLAQIIADASIDLAVIIGNDQMEIFDERLVPAFSVLYGDTITNYEFTAERMAALPAGIATSIPGYIPKGGAVYAGHPELARFIIASVVRDQFDVAAMKSLPKPETPHAFGFVYRRLMRDNPVPSVPVLLNTFYTPNQPTVRRCYDFGAAVMRAIRAWKSEARVAVIASGGLSHFAVDEGLDRALIDALRSRNIDGLASMGEAVFQSGTSELKNWVALAGAMASMGCPPTLIDYVPCYRSIAGTGSGMGFVYWKP